MSFEEQIISREKYPSIFSPQMETIAFSNISKMSARVSLGFQTRETFRVFGNLMKPEARAVRCTFCFPNTDHVMILRRFDPLSCLLKRVHTSMNMFARQRIKSPEYHHVICIGKTKCTSEKGPLFYFSTN